MNNVDMIGVLLVHPIERSTIEGYVYIQVIFKIQIRPGQ